MKSTFVLPVLMLVICLLPLAVYSTYYGGNHYRRDSYRRYDYRRHSSSGRSSGNHYRRGSSSNGDGHKDDNNGGDTSGGIGGHSSSGSGGHYRGPWFGGKNPASSSASGGSRSHNGPKGKIIFNGCDLGRSDSVTRDCYAIRSYYFGKLDWKDDRVLRCVAEKWRQHEKDNSWRKPKQIPAKKCDEGKRNYQCQVCYGAKSESECIQNGWTEECAYGQDACILEQHQVEGQTKFWRRCGNLCECGPHDFKPNPWEDVPAFFKYKFYCQKAGCHNFGCKAIGCEISSSGFVPLVTYENVAHNPTRCRCDGWCHEKVYRETTNPDYNLPCCKDTCETCGHLGAYNAPTTACATTTAEPTTMPMMMGGGPADKKK